MLGGCLLKGTVNEFLTSIISITLQYKFLFLSHGLTYTTLSNFLSHYMSLILMGFDWPYINRTSYCLIYRYYRSNYFPSPYNLFCLLWKIHVWDAETSILFLFFSMSLLVIVKYQYNKDLITSTWGLRSYHQNQTPHQQLPKKMHFMYLSPKTTIIALQLSTLQLFREFFLKMGCVIFRPIHMGFLKVLF